MTERVAYSTAHNPLLRHARGDRTNSRPRPGTYLMLNKPTTGKSACTDLGQTARSVRSSF